MSAKISLLWINVNLVEHSFYITIERNRFFTEATENAAETVDQVGPLKKMSVVRFPLNSALASNTTWILSGCCGWYTPWCGMYQTRPLSRWSSSSGTLSACPSSSSWRSYNDPDIRYLFSRCLSLWSRLNARFQLFGNFIPSSFSGKAIS